MISTKTIEKIKEKAVLLKMYKDNPLAIESMADDIMKLCEIDYS